MSFTKRFSMHLLLALCAAIITNGQHSGGYDMANSYSGSGIGYGGYGGGNGYNVDEGEERPKVQLGIRLKIPAIKFELPRLSLPKITISAKIRQPDRPRTITLPEINLDSSSKLSPPEFNQQNGQGVNTNSYAAHNSRNRNQGYVTGPNDQAYSSGHTDAAGKEERISSFSFSSNEEGPEGYGNNLNQANLNRVRYRTQGYHSTNVHPAYLMTNQNNNNVPFSYYQHSIKNSNAGFDTAVYTEPRTQMHTNKQNSYPYHQNISSGSKHSIHRK